MLILRRKVGEQIIVDGTITVTVEYIRGASVVLGISAPPSVSILRAELATLSEDQDSAKKKITKWGEKLSCDQQNERNANEEKYDNTSFYGEASS